MDKCSQYTDQATRSNHPDFLWLHTDRRQAHEQLGAALAQVQALTNQRAALMVAMGAARMTPVAPDPAAMDPFEMARAELVEALARMVNHVIESGKGGVQPAIDQLALIRTTLANVANIDDFLADLDAAERALLAYLTA